MNSKPYRLTRFFTCIACVSAIAVTTQAVHAIGPALGSLHVCKNVQWGDQEVIQDQTFEICVSGPLDVPGIGQQPTCIPFGPEGGSHVFEDLMPGEYYIYETDPGKDWEVSHWVECPLGLEPSSPDLEVPGDDVTVEVVSDGETCVTFRNTWDQALGTLIVEKIVDTRGLELDPEQEFQICLIPDGKDPICQNADYDGGTIIWGDLLPGTYTVTETDPGDLWTVQFGSQTTMSQEAELIGCSGTYVTITNTYAKLKLTSMCSYDPSVARLWRVHNPFPFPVEFDWDLYNGTQSGTLTVPANEDLFFETLVEANNTVRIFVNEVQHDIKAGRGECRLLVEKYNDLNRNNQMDEEEQGLSGWEFTALSTNEINPNPISGTTDADGLLFFPNLPSGTFQVCETLIPGWANSTPVCQEVTVDSESQALLQFGNFEAVPGSITILKATDPAGGSSFNFTAVRDQGDDEETVASFSLDDTGSHVLSELDAGLYRITEDDPAAWNLGNLTCGDAAYEVLADGVEINLDWGEEVTCTFTNECVEAPELTCPADITIPSGGTFDIDDLQAPAAEGNCGFDIEITREETSHEEGTCPIAEVVTVTWTAVGFNNMTASCQQQIFITDADSDNDGIPNCEDDDEEPQQPIPDDGEDVGQQAPLEEVIVTTTSRGAPPFCGAAGVVPMMMLPLCLLGMRSLGGRRWKRTSR